MGNLRDTLDRNDSDESFISQFETTLTIRPSRHEVEEGEIEHEVPENDISIDHTVLHGNSTFNYTRDDQSIVNITELEEEEILLEQIPKFKTKRRYSLQPQHATRKTNTPSSSSSGRSSPSDDYYRKLDPKYVDVLRPSPLIDYSLEKFQSTFADFLGSNPHIQLESPRFLKETDKTLVILLPYSAEHAFGRKWVTKSYLSTIFERPQRLLAACIGVSAALTMYPFFYKILNLTKKGLILLPHVLRIHGKNWPKKLFELCLESHDKLLNGKLEVPEDWNTGDIYLTPKTINAIEGVIGTIETAVDLLFGEDPHSLAFVVIRPPGHHSHACLPSGFCLLNNVQIGIEYAFELYNVTHCAILDIDLHHGDGLQDICWERGGFAGDYGQEPDDELDHLKENPRDDYGKRFAQYPKVGYFSLHDVKLYPTEFGFATKDNIRNALTCVMDHDVNIWNVHLQEWKTEEEFYKHYQTKYVAILNRANQFLNQAKKQYEQEQAEYSALLAKYNKYLLKPHLYTVQPMDKPTPPPAFKPLIMISAGFDALEYENSMMQRHGINVPTSFYARFTNDVVKLAKIHTGGKVISFLEGGYSDGALSTGIFSHLIGLNHADDTEGPLWNESWGTEHVMKELIRGCKKNWTAYKKPQSEMSVWANEVIKLGRSMMPNAILPQNYVYDYQKESEPVKTERTERNRMVKDLIDHRTNLASPIKADPEDDRKMMRHTRLYHKKKVER